MLKLEKLVVTIEESKSRNTLDNSLAIQGTVEFDLRDYKEFHTNAIAKEIIRLAGYAHPGKLSDAIQKAVSFAALKAAAETSLVMRVDLACGSFTVYSLTDGDDLFLTFNVIMVK